MADPSSDTSDIQFYDHNDSTGEWDNNNHNQSSTSALYPLIPPLPLPLSSKYSHTFQPSAPPSAPPRTSSPWASAPVYPSTDSYSYSPTTYTPSYPVDYTTNHQAEDYTAYDSATNPWHASSHSPNKEDLQPEQPLYPEPSAPPIYPNLPVESNYHNFHHQHQRQERQYPHSAWDGQKADHDQTPSYPRLDSTFLIQHPSSNVSAQRLRELYSNRFLQDLPRRLSDYERSSVTHSVDDSSNDVFFHHLKSYEVAYEAVQQSHLAIFNLQQKAKGYASKLWAVQTKSEIAKATCGDGATIAHNYSYQVGQHEPKVAEKLKKSLSRLHKQRTKSLLRMQFEESSSRLWIQDHFAEFLNSVHWKSDSETGLQRARKYLDILFHFERSVRRQPDFDTATGERQASATGLDASVSSSDEAATGADESVASTAKNSILRSIHDWIDLLAGALLAFGGFEEREHLIVQVLRSRQVANWATNYVQCNLPTMWSQEFEEFYLTQLQLVLCGSATLDHEATKEPVSDMSLDIGSTLDEEDCSALLDQMDVAVFFNRMLDEHSGMHSYDGTLYQRDMSEREALQALTTTRRIFDILLRGLERRIGFTVVAKRLSQTLCQLAQILGDHLLVFGPIKSKAFSDETFSITIDRYSPPPVNANLSFEIETFAHVY